MNDLSEWLITRIRVQGFRSLHDSQVHFDPVTVLVGPNSSGKSSIVDSLSFLQEALLNSPEAAFRSRGGFSAVLTNLGKKPEKTEGGRLADQVAIEVQVKSRAGDFFEGTYSVRFGMDAAQRLVVLQERAATVTGADQEVHSFAVEGGKWIEAANGVEPRIAPDRLVLPLLSGLRDFLPLYNALTSVRYYEVSPQAVSAPHEPERGMVLSADGSNAASVLKQIHKANPPLYEKVVQSLASIVSEIKNVRPKDLDRFITLEFEETISSRNTAQFEARSMSEGTLRALAVLLAIYAMEPSATIILEEPERAIHPGAAAVLAEAIQEAGQRTQILVTTHSPDLITYFSLASLRAVKRERGITVVGPVKDAQIDAIKESLFTAGEIHRFEGLSPS